MMGCGVFFFLFFLFVFLFFFFQAEDGIRDRLVTGVQTCALPIYEEFEENLSEFSKNFVPNGAENSAKIAAQILEEKR